jgi:hypothetical protein
VERILSEINLLVAEDAAAALARQVCDLARARTDVADIDARLAT